MVHGQELFSQRCTACHALDRNEIGPMLNGVVGRAAGSAAGYNYSPALRSAGLTWSEDKLDQWLADPKKMVPGVRMPVRVLDTPSRHDIIGYLRKVSEPDNQVSGNARASRPEY
ncbi:c-type cytochrome [Bradyrhizobium cenepequi]|uniref:c-type cytochrome n=1 Tax=Bradyrhizobium cenepequi TaxID=2821403 RepID=UPI001CE28E5D|nr:c-type cytochrome [Bradyrhizobium cenepequi]